MTGMLVWWKIALCALLGSGLFYAGTFVGRTSPQQPSVTPSAGFTRVAVLPLNANARGAPAEEKPTVRTTGDIAYFVEQTKKKQADAVPARATTASAANILLSSPKVASTTASSTVLVSAFDAPGSAGSVAVVYGTGIPTSTLPAEECHFETAMFPRYRMLIINEVGWMGTSEDSAHEWIELKNPEIDPIPIKGYWLLDEAEQIVVQFPDITIPSGGFLLLERGEDALPDHTADIVYAGALSNSNEGLRVFDAYCTLLDSVIAGPKWPAGSVAEKRSMERGGDWEWYTYTGKAVNDVLGTPGKKNVAASRTSSLVTVAQVATTTTSSPRETETQPPPVVVAESTSSIEETSSSPPAPASAVGHVIISEVFAGSEQSSDDEFVELYNPTSQAVDLTGWFIKKKSSSGSESSLVAATRLQGKQIPAGGYLLIARENKYLGTVTPDALWASSISLAYTNNAVLLYGADGVLVDETAWSELSKGQSWRREPVGSEVFSVGTPSPKQ